MNVKELLLKAADLLERDGWVQHTRYASNGARCVLGALDDALGGMREADHEAPDVWKKAVTLIADSVEAPYEWTFRVAEWNNAKGRTAQQVIRKLRKLAK